jgi:imidazoleglycerol phosphate dehydratase HisB
MRYQLSYLLKTGYRAASSATEHCEQGFHESYGAGDADAVNYRHLPVFIPFRVKKARHHHYAASYESEDHDEIEAVFKRGDEAVQGACRLSKRSVCASKVQ